MALPKFYEVLPFKLLFFIRQEAGRVLRQDITTMKLVLDATPEVGNNYGILINQVPEQIAELLQRNDNFERFLTQLFTGIDSKRRCARSNIMVVKQIDRLDGVDDSLIDANELVSPKGMTLSSFVHEK